MKLKELREIELETVNVLRNKVKAGDCVAAEVLLKHLRETSIAIQKWKENKDRIEKIAALQSLQTD